MKFFNTAGPINQNEHYKIDPLSRWDMDEILTLIAQKKYFVLHAPRQTGKTSCLLALRDYLNAEDKYNCVYANFELGQMARNDIDKGIQAVLAELHGRIENTLEIKLLFTVNEIIKSHGANKALNAYITAVSKLLNKPLILLIDEIDALIGDTLVSVLRQLRAGYDTRPADFPQSVILCGVRDIKDYRIHKSDNDIITGGSCFNIKAESLTLGNFSEDEVKKLYAEHTKETGQIFEKECFPLIMRYTDGQPWLVNALGYEVTYKMKPNRDPSITITAEMIEIAKERLIMSRATHLDQLVDKLREDRVRRVIEPMIYGDNANIDYHDEQYCIDLGLIKRTERGLVISNDIYKEIIPRELTYSMQNNFLTMFNPEWINDDKSLNVEKLMTMFIQFWREHSEIWSKDMAGYHEAAPHLTFFSFLQRVSNGHGFIDREYGLGMKRADLYLRWKSPAQPTASQCGGQVGEQRIIFELKILKERDSYAAIKAEAVEQTAIYADKCNATEAHIIIFDRCGKTDWQEKVFTDSGEAHGYKIKIWGI